MKSKLVHIRLSVQQPPPSPGRTRTTEVRRSKRITAKHIRHFTRDLSIMLNARMLLIDSITILARQQDSAPFLSVLSQILTRMQGGTDFSACLRSYPHLFSDLYVNLVEVGEMTGRLGEMLTRVAIYLEKMSDLKRKLIQAMTYPLLVVCVALLSVGFIMMWVVPTFEDVFTNFGSELPLPTRIVVSVSGFIQSWLIHILLAAIGTGFGIRYMGKIASVRRFIDEILLGLPLLGDLIRKNHIAQFCRTLGTLLEGGVSLLQALDMASQSSRNFHIRQDIARMRQLASRGEQLARSLHTSQIFPLMVTQMIAVGEETAELPFMLTKVAEFYDAEIDNAIETLASVVEPVVIVLLGIIIGAILVSIYLPLFKLSAIV